jgi:hypothetical protein
VSRPTKLSEVKGQRVHRNPDATYAASGVIAHCSACGGAGEIREISGGLGLTGECEACHTDIVAQQDPDAVIGQRMVAAPSNPMAVARQYLDENHHLGDAHLLRHHRGIHYEWRTTLWAETDLDALRAALYGWLEHASYEKLTKDGVEVVPFEPTRVKVGNIVEAVEAIGHINTSLDVPSWLDGTTTSAAEVVSVANGLLHVPTRTLAPHRPAFFNHHSLAFAYDAGAPQPTRWLRFLHELWGDDEESISTLGETWATSSAAALASRRCSCWSAPSGPAKAPSCGY